MQNYQHSFIKNFIIFTPNMAFLGEKLKSWSDKVEICLIQHSTRPQIVKFYTVLQVLLNLIMAMIVHDSGGRRGGCWQGTSPTQPWWSAHQHFISFQSMQMTLHSLVSYESFDWTRGTKTQNFPDSNFLRAKAFRTKRAKPSLATNLKSVCLPLTTLPKNAYSMFYS